MSDGDLTLNPSPLTAAEQYRQELERQTVGNQLALIEQRLNQLFASLPDRASVEVTRQNIGAIMEAMVRVASKENMIVISDRLGKVEAAVEATAKSSAFNERDVAQLKEGQSSIREMVFREVERLQQGLKQQTMDLNGSFGQQTKDLKADLDSQTKDLKADLDKQTDSLKDELTTQTRELVKQISDLKLEVSEARRANAVWLLATVLVIIGTIIAAATFFFRTAPDRASPAVSATTSPK